MVSSVVTKDDLAAPMPYARNLERAKTPSKDRILDAIRKVCDGAA